MREATFPVTEEKPDIDVNSPPPDKVLSAVHSVSLLIERGNNDPWLNE